MILTADNIYCDNKDCYEWATIVRSGPWRGMTRIGNYLITNGWQVVNGMHFCPNHHIKED